MSSAKLLMEKIGSGAYDPAFAVLYRDKEAARARYADAVKAFTDRFGEEGEPILFSAPGRTELGGNHTDHNHGRVLAASVNLDVIAVAVPRRGNRVRIQSAGYPMDVVELTDLAIHPEEENRSASLVRGTLSRFQQLGYVIGGFDAYTTSDVLKGSGLSSSAAFEVLLGNILSTFFNGGRVAPVEIAKIAQYAENAYFGKPSGLMDQTASAVGGIIAIDFADPASPVVQPVDYDFSSSGYSLCIVDTGGSHADLTSEYAAITVEMRQVAEYLGVSYLRDADPSRLTAALPALRERFGDRAVLRAMHFFADNDRVQHQAEALRHGDFSGYLRLVLESGHSSCEYLQNAYAVSDCRCQGVPLALCLAQQVLAGRGAWRVHGGGFGGTTQNYVPHELVPAFTDAMEAAFGPGCCHALTIRPAGGLCLDTYLEKIRRN